MHPKQIEEQYKVCFLTCPCRAQVRMNVERHIVAARAAHLGCELSARVSNQQNRTHSEVRIAPQHGAALPAPPTRKRNRCYLSPTCSDHVDRVSTKLAIVGRCHYRIPYQSKSSYILPLRKANTKDQWTRKSSVQGLSSDLNGRSSR